MRNKLVLVLCFLVIFTMLGCASASKHASDVQQGLQGDKVTVGTVQREIRKGMSSAEVIQALGSPNIVSTDEKGREVWIYDKLATDHVYSKSSGGVSALILGLIAGGSGGAAGGAGPSYSSSAGAQSTSQRTLTVIIKFDEQHKVRDFAYHSSRF